MPLLPQGGVEKGEEYLAALHREVREETGLEHLLVLDENPNLLQYDFPASLTAKVAKEYRGQAQKWFLCRTQEGVALDISLADEQEFIDLRWIEPDILLREIVSWKRDVYREGLAYFKLLKNLK